MGELGGSGVVVGKKGGEVSVPKIQVRTNFNGKVFPNLVLEAMVDPKPLDLADHPDLNMIKQKTLSYAKLERGTIIFPLKICFNIQAMEGNLKIPLEIITIQILE